MKFPKLYVESDGDRVPKDVYLCDASEKTGQITLGDRVLTLNCGGLPDRVRFEWARQVVKACNNHEALLAACRMALESMENPPEVILSTETDAYRNLKAAIALCL